jgi:LCP family protein required for cell wall assembly
MRTTLKRGVSRGTTNGTPAVPPSPLTHMSRYGPPRRHIGVTVARAFMWVIIGLLVLIGGLAGGAWLWAEDTIALTRPQTEDDKKAQAILDEAPALTEPAVALFVGYDWRKEDGPKSNSRSDTLMLVRADPQNKTVSMLSLPRDLLVETSGCEGHAPRLAKINEAYTDCGITGAIETVRNLTGVKINYYVTVNFAGFQQVVDSLGGVFMDVDRRYFNDNSSFGERYSAINLEPGYQKLGGRNALAFVRFRHTDNDFFRNARQQAFVKAVKQQLADRTSLTKLPGVVRTLAKAMTIGAGGGKDVDFQTLLSFAKLAYDLPSGNLTQPRLENLEDNSAFQLTIPDGEMDRVVTEFLNPDPDAGKKATSVAVGEKPRSDASDAPPAADVTVETMNGNGVVGAAGDAALLLAQRSYQSIVGGTAAKTDYFNTEIVYDGDVEGAEAAAAVLAKLFDPADVVAATPSDALETMVRVTVGTTFQGHLAPAPRDTTPTHQEANVVTDASAVEPLIRQARGKAGFPLLVPTVHESSSSLSTLRPIRVYGLGGDGEQAVRIVYNGPTELDYWGIQETNWTDPPVLEGPTVKRRFGGREYSLYYSGSHLHMVAFQENGAAYWVVNTLLDGLSNETMLAIAKGLKPLPKN